MHCPTCKTRFGEGAVFCAHDGTALVPDPAGDLVGQVLAERYRLVRLIGEGGMGQVYEAHHVNINKRFAIKLLRPEVIGSSQSLQRFRQEAWAASSIGHPNIVDIDDFATLPSGQVYLAMELLDGVSLAERLRHGPPLPLADALALLIAVARGLAAAHAKGIIHRDMKPENIFIARKGDGHIAKILDFGIAKMSGGDEPSNLTRTGAIFGTPLYMSPEQARGRPADARADVYALGIILYELATGRVPFQGDSAVEILTQHISAAPAPPRVSAALDAVILRALAKDPDARFQSMSDLVAALEPIAATLPPPSLREPTPLTTGRNTPIAAQGALPTRPSLPDLPPPRHTTRNLALACAAVLALLTTIFLVRKPQPQPPTQAQTQPPTQTQPQPPTQTQPQPQPQPQPHSEPAVAVAPAPPAPSPLPTRDKRHPKKRTPKRHELLEPYTPPAAAAAPKPAPAPAKPAPASAPAKPASLPKPHDPLAARLDHQAAGAHRVSPLYRGTAADEGDRSDWYLHLDASRCYTFLAEGGDGVTGIYVYLWGPTGHRVRDSRVKTPHAQMTYCAPVAGTYHFQAKVSDGHGEYRAAVYTR